MLIIDIVGPNSAPVRLSVVILEHCYFQHSLWMLFLLSATQSAAMHVKRFAEYLRYLDKMPKKSCYGSSLFSAVTSPSAAQLSAAWAPEVADPSRVVGQGATCISLQRHLLASRCWYGPGCCWWLAVSC